MFGALSVFFDVLLSLAGKKPGFSSRTELPTKTKPLPAQRESARVAAPPLVESPAAPTEPPVTLAQPPAEPTEPQTQFAEPPPSPEPPPISAEPPAILEEYPEPPPKPRKHDDLRRIEGIGPKISGLLRDAGITTFSQLADTHVDRLKEILAAAGIGGLADPSSWTEQARLAAAEDWEGLRKLKEEL
jgi:predicted flap endonuclease-1-like 5' DNA nuclease